jgi:hypothetical protein
VSNKNQEQIMNKEVKEPVRINGKIYPMWNQFVEKKEQWIGGILEDSGDSIDRHMGAEKMKTKIKDITLEPNGEESAMFHVIGEDFSCGGDVEHLGITAGESGYMTFSGYGGHSWRIKNKETACPD